MIMIVISFALVKFYAFAILYVLIVMQIKLVVVGDRNNVRNLFKKTSDSFYPSLVWKFLYYPFQGLPDD